MNKQNLTGKQVSAQHTAKKYYLGLDLGGTNIVAGVVDEAYHIISKKSIPANAGRSIEEVTYDMAEVSKEAVRGAGLRLSDVSSWGIGMPSCVNPATNLLVHANNFGWKNVPIYDYLQKHISLPIYISNDANCAAYGEVLAGAAKNYTDAIMLTLGTGVGGGIIMNKKIYAGADNMGAELGHTKLVYNGVRCTCGQYGCLESYCSSTALIRRTKEAVKEHPDSLIMGMAGQDANKINGEIVFESAKKGDALAIEIVDEYIRYLAAGISTFIVIFRPQVIILGGGIAHAGDLLLEPLNEKLFDCTFAAEEIGIPKVIRAALGNDAGLIGAAFLEKSI
ncbi:MAG: ROK family protein [Tannerella sp.]|jgi:glucokinase|nr:ROK family protein [Tannerella sp.]